MSTSEAAATAVAPYRCTTIDVNKPLKKTPAIEALLCSSVAWGDLSPLFFVGTSDGSLHGYVPSTAANASAKAKTPIPTFLRWHTTYKKLYHECSRFVDAWGVYATIQEPGVVLYALPLHSNPHLDGNGGGMSTPRDGDRRVVVPNTKHALLLGVHEGAGVLCVWTKQQTLQTYDWTSRQRLELRSQHVMSTAVASWGGSSSSTGSTMAVQRMVVLGDRFVLLVGKKEWSVVEVDEGTVVVVSETTPSVALDVIVDAMAVPLRLQRRKSNTKPQGVWEEAVVVGKTCAIRIGIVEEQQPEPFASSVELRVVVQKVMEFGKMPRAAVYHHPYLLVEMQDQLDVYNSSTFQVVQVLALKSIEGSCIPQSPQGTKTTTPFLFVITTPFSIQMLQMMPVEKQVRDLMNTKRFEDAVSLIEMCPDDVNMRRFELMTLYTEYGMERFRQRDFERALHFFYEADIDALEVLQLYPHDLLPRSGLSDFPRNQRDVTTRLVPAFTLEGDDLVKAMHSLLHFLWKTRGTSQDESRDHQLYFQEEKYCQLVDTVLLKCLVLCAEAVPRAQGHRIEKRLNDLVHGPNQCDIGEVEAFMRAYNRSETLLAFYSSRQLHRKAIELLEDMERTRNLEAEAIQMASEDKSMSKSSSSRTAEDCMRMTADYLRGLGADYEDLVFEFSKRIIAASPELGLSIFTMRTNKANDISPAQIMAHLQSCQVGPASSASTKEAPSEVPISSSEGELVSLPLTDSRHLAIEYVTQVIMAGNVEVPSRVHDDAVNLMLDAITAELQQSGSVDDGTTRNIRLTSRVESQRGILRCLREKLLRFLEFDGAHYHPERILSRTPKEMVDERATLLSRLGRHHDVLQLFATELRDASLAEAYCNKVYEAHMADSSIYSTLLRLYLRPPLAYSSSSSGMGMTSRSLSPPKIWRSSSLSSSASPSSQLSEATLAAVAVMNKYAERIDVPTALEILPPEVPVQTLSAFFSRVLERNVECFRNGQVKKQLSKMENFKVRDLLTTKRKQSVTVWSSHCCEICGKKLGTSTFVRMPGGSLVHYVCQPAP